MAKALRPLHTQQVSALYHRLDQSRVFNHLDTLPSAATVASKPLHGGCPPPHPRNAIAGCQESGMAPGGLVKAHKQSVIGEQSNDNILQYPSTAVYCTSDHIFKFCIFSIHYIVYYRLPLKNKTGPGKNKKKRHGSWMTRDEKKTSGRG